ncbi:MAG: cardiolipin synthase [Oscillibacter sp.]|nr:cardiolipin synthase [Oscillibacter sp.]
MERVERRVSALVCLLMCAVGVLGQIAVTILLTTYLRDNGGYIYAGLQIVAFANAVSVYQRPGSPSFKLAWMCLLVASPVAGLILFWLWGGLQQAKNLSMGEAPQVLSGARDRLESEGNLSALRRRSPAWGRLSAYLHKRGFWLYRAGPARYFSDGAAFFEDLIAHMEQARSYIFLEYYILAEGRVWNQVFDVLRRRAADGVEVYIIFDDFGNLFRLTRDTLRAMREAGIQAQVFNPVNRYISRIYFNYRDHRKLAVIDGRAAWTGGINMADEYANLVERFGHWKDSAVRIEGEGVRGFAAQFIRMWKRLGRSLPRDDSFYLPPFDADTPASLLYPPAEGRGFVQPFSDGPMRNPDNIIEETYLQLISSARETLWITTPYYAVEESMQTALCIAADGGVDVRLFVPAVPDHKLAYMVAETYWGELLRHGVKVYKYTPGFLHAKSVLADGECALVGTTNMDYRTFQLHYECAVLLYHMPAALDLRADLVDVAERSTPYTLEEWNGRPWYRKGVASLLKLGAIWL